MYRHTGGYSSVENEPPIGQTLLQTGEVLREHFVRPYRQYFVAVILDDGTLQTFSGPDTSRSSTGDETQFFDKEGFMRARSGLESRASRFVNHDFASDGYKESTTSTRNLMMDQQHMPLFRDDEVPDQQARKRARDLADEGEAPTTVPAMNQKRIKIGDPCDVRSFYKQRFNNCQQGACKLIAKAWVQALAQSTSDGKAPDWWPKPLGTEQEVQGSSQRTRSSSRERAVIERVYLLIHILSMIVKPKNRQHRDIQKLDLNVDKLEKKTTEALSEFFADKEDPTNAEKRPFLNQIFEVAKQEERFKKGEIGGKTEVCVMADDKIPDSFASSNDDNDPMYKEEDEQDVLPNRLMAIPGLSSSLSGYSLKASLYCRHFPPEVLSIGANKYPPTMAQNMAQDQPGSGTLAIDMSVPPSQDYGHRSSVFSAQVKHDGENDTTVYTQQWQPGSTVTSSSSMYVFTQQPPKPPATAFASTGIPMNQAQPYMNASFDGLTRGYDPNQSTIFHNKSVPQPPKVYPAQGYDYMSYDDRGLPGIKVEDEPRQAMH